MTELMKKLIILAFCVLVIFILCIFLWTFYVTTNPNATDTEKWIIIVIIPFLVLVSGIYSIVKNNHL